MFTRCLAEHALPVVFAAASDWQVAAGTALLRLEANCRKQLHFDAMRAE